MRSLSLFGDEIADGSFGSYPPKRSLLLCVLGGADQTFGDEAIDDSWLIERHQASDGLAMVCHCDFLAVADDLKVATQVVSQLSYSSFHPLSMALSDEHFWPHSQSWRCLAKESARKMRVDRDAL